MKHGDRIHVPVSIAETRISKRYDAIPSGTLYPNADEIKYMQRLVIYKACLPPKPSLFLFYSFLSVFFYVFIGFCYYSFCSIEFQYIFFIVYCVQMYSFQDSAIIVLNKPPKLPVKVCMSIIYIYICRNSLSWSLFWDFDFLLMTLLGESASS